jgi:hypothetical protein
MLDPGSWRVDPTKATNAHVQLEVLIMDPAVLGTLMIGLDNVRMEQEQEMGLGRPRVQATRTDRWRDLRSRSALVLRHIAERIDPGQVPAGHPGRA